MSNYDTVKEWRSRPESKVMIAAQARRYRARHPNKVAAVKKAYRARNPKSVKEQNARTIARRKADPEGQRIRYQRWRLKKDAEKAALAGREKPEVCDLCGENNLRIVFDHCHSAGHFRGWLCDRCNKVLGLLKDDAALLRRMASYLERLGDGKAQSCDSEEDSVIGIRIAGEQEVSNE